MPRTTTVPKVRDTVLPTASPYPLPHDEAARRARREADTKTRAAARKGVAVADWTDIYLRAYRRFTARPFYAGPLPVWPALPTRKGRAR